MTDSSPFDLTIAYETMHKLGLEDGDLGYAYWYRVRKLLEDAAGMQARIDALSLELERARAQLRDRHG